MGGDGGSYPTHQLKPINKTPSFCPPPSTSSQKGRRCSSIPTAGPGSPRPSRRSPGQWDGSGTNPRRQLQRSGNHRRLPPSHPSRDQQQGWGSDGLQEHLKAREETPVWSLLGSTGAEREKIRKKSWRKVRGKKNQVKKSVCCPYLGRQPDCEKMLTAGFST